MEVELRKFEKDWMTKTELWALELIFGGQKVDVRDFYGFAECCKGKEQTADPVQSPFWKSKKARLDFKEPAYPHSALEAGRVLEHRSKRSALWSPLPIEEETWPEWQCLSSRFVEYVLLDVDFSANRTRHRTLISHANIKGEIDLEAARIEGDIEMSSCKFCSAISMKGMEITGYLTLSGSHFLEELSADGLFAKRTVYLDDGAVFENGVSLKGAVINGALACGSSFIKAGAGGFSLNADRAQLSGGLFLNTAARCIGEVRCVDITTDRDLTFAGSYFSTVKANQDACAIRLDRAKVGGSVFLREGLAVEGGVSLGRAFVGKDIQLWNAAIGGMLDLSGSTVKGELLLDETERGVRGPSWGKGSEINLRNAAIGTLHGSRDSWRQVEGLGKDSLYGGLTKYLSGRVLVRDYLPKNIDGLKVEKLAGGIGGASLDSMPVADLRQWLTCNILHNRPNQDFSPAPFLSISKALKDSGFESASRSVLIALEKKRTHSLGRFKKTLFWSLIRRFWIGPVTGYGYRSNQGVYFLLTLILSFALLGVAFECNYFNKGWNSVTLEDLFAWIGFSVETAFPIVDLDPVNDTFLEDRFKVSENWVHGGKSYEELPPLIRGAFMAERFVGLAILATFIAGLTGWAERRGES